MRRWCRSAFDHSALRNASTISSASGTVCMRPPMPINWALLCSRASLAVSVLHASAQRAPGTLFAAICSPLPEPPMTMPRLSLSPTVFSAAAMQNAG